MSQRTLKPQLKASQLETCKVKACESLHRKQARSYADSDAVIAFLEVHFSVLCIMLHLPGKEKVWLITTKQVKQVMLDFSSGSCMVLRHLFDWIILGGLRSQNQFHKNMFSHVCHIGNQTQHVMAYLCMDLTAPLAIEMGN